MARTCYKSSSGNYWAYDNDNTNVSKYGYLYDWNTANKVCPTGWHLPSDNEWSVLTDYLGGVLSEIAGTKMKTLLVGKMVATALMRAVLTPFRAVTVTTLGISTTLVARSLVEFFRGLFRPFGGVSCTKILAL